MVLYFVSIASGDTAAILSENCYIHTPNKIWTTFVCYGSSFWSVSVFNHENMVCSLMSDWCDTTDSFMHLLMWQTRCTNTSCWKKEMCERPLIFLRLESTLMTVAVSSSWHAYLFHTFSHTDAFLDSLLMTSGMLWFVHFVQFCSARDVGRAKSWSISFSSSEAALPCQCNRFAEFKLAKRHRYRAMDVDQWWK